MNWRLKMQAIEAKKSNSQQKQGRRRGLGLLGNTYDDKIKDLKVEAENKMNEFLEMLFVEIFKAEQFYIEKQSDLIQQFIQLQVETNERANNYLTPEANNSFKQTAINEEGSFVGHNRT